jgi:hypothetical protein
MLPDKKSSNALSVVHILATVFQDEVGVAVVNFLVESSEC